MLDKILTTKVTKDEWEEFSEVAKYRGVSKSSLLRIAVQDFLRELKVSYQEAFEDEN